MGVWEFSERDGVLVRDGERTSLTVKAAAVLALLVRHKGRVVSKADILSDVWGGLSVTPDLVREYVSDIRAALGDDALAPRYIETVRGRGYRLLRGVAFAETGPDLPVRRPRIAVLRPEVFGGDARTKQIADALGLEVIRDLACYPDLAVISHCASYPIAGHGMDAAVQTLSADVVVTLSVTFGSERLAVSWSLIDASDLTVVATHRRDRARDEMPRLTYDVAAEISASLGRFHGDVHRVLAARVKRMPATDRGAYEAYLLAVACEDDHGLASWREGLRQANRSIELDPTFARAWHMRGTFLKGLAYFFCDPDLDRETARRQSLEARQKSLRLDPNDPHILAWSAEIDTAKGDITGARVTLLRAADLGATQPDTLAYCALSFALVLGAFQEANRMINEALRLSPVPPDWYLLVQCRVAFFTGDYETATRVAQCNSTALPSLLFGAMAWAMRGEPARAQASYAELLKTFPTFNPQAYADDLILSPAAKERFAEGLSTLAPLVVRQPECADIGPVR